MAVSLALSCEACSFVFTTGPPDDAARYPPERSMDCSTTVVPPVLDTVIATYQAVRTGVALGRSDYEYATQPISRNADIALGGSLFALFAISAGWGYYATTACSDAKEAQLRRGVRMRRRNTESSR
jgi:hypothetical protein